MGCCFFLQEIFLTQGSNSSLLRWQVDSLHQGSVTALLYMWIWSVSNTVKPGWCPLGLRAAMQMGGVGRKGSKSRALGQGKGPPPPEECSRNLHGWSCLQLGPWSQATPTYTEVWVRLYFNQDPSSALSTRLILYVCSLYLFSFLLSFLGKFSYENLQPYFSTKKRETFFSRTPKKDGGNPGAPGGHTW